LIACCEVFERPTAVAIPVSHTNSPVFAVPFSAVSVVFNGIFRASLTTLLFIPASNVVGDTSPLINDLGRGFIVFSMSSTCQALFALPRGHRRGIRLAISATSEVY